MRIIAFIIDAATVRNILPHLGDPIASPRIAPARGPAIMGRGRCRVGSPGPAMGLVGPARTGLRIRSAHRLVPKYPHPK
jgi:hypothetical protein